MTGIAWATMQANDGGNRRHCLAIRTGGGEGNSDGIAAKVVMTVGGQGHVLEVSESDSYLSSNDMRGHAGLGDLEPTDIAIR